MLVQRCWEQNLHLHGMTRFIRYVSFSLPYEHAMLPVMKLPKLHHGAASTLHLVPPHKCIIQQDQGSRECLR
jgi:hypothetical protein